MTFRNSCNFPPKIKCLICYPITKDIVYSKILLNGNKFEYASEITFRIKVFCMGSVNRQSFYLPVQTAISSLK